MGASAADDHPPRPCSERSLLRSFSAIHRSLVDDTTPRQANHHRGEDRNHHEMSFNDLAVALQESRCKRERRGSSKRWGNVLQDRSSSRRARRVTIAPPPAPAKHATKVFPTSVGAGILRPQGQWLPPHFSRSDVAPQPSRAPFAPARLQRSLFAPLTAERAHEMVMRLASERQQHYKVQRGSSTPPGAGGYDRGFDAGVEELVPPSEVRFPVQVRGHRGFRRDYSLGETARCFSHMIVHPPMHRAARAAASLKKHDFAFVRRSDGSYTYAIVSYRHATHAPDVEEFMVFVVNRAGSTKIVRRRHWGSFVRLVSPEGMDPRLHEGMRGSTGPRSPPSPVDLEPHIQSQERPVLCHEIAPPVVCQEIEDDGDCMPPEVIVFSSAMYDDDDCSAISSVSNQAM